MVTALDIARYFIHLASPEDGEDADALSNMRLQKLVYYAQCWHLSATGTPLFQDEIEAWQYGPVIKAVYYEFKSMGSAIPSSHGCVAEGLSGNDREFLGSIWERYKNHSATSLSAMTHRESPWIDAWATRDPNDRFPNIEITCEAMRSYYFPRFVEALRKRDSRIDPKKWKASAEDIAAGRVRTAGEVRRELHSRRS